jgi:hypothetical protein
MNPTAVLQGRVRGLGLSATVAGTTDSVLWLPLIQVGERSALGISEDGCWLQSTADGLIDPSAPSYVFLLPILLRRRCDVRAEIVGKLSGTEVLPDSVDDLLMQVVSCGLRSGGYWAELSIEWLEEHPNAALFLGAIREAQPTLSQRGRQRAKKLLTRIQR